MLRTILLTVLTLTIAVGGGAASLWYALKAQDGVGAVTIGGWTTFPNIGTAQADPYSKARVAREGSLALGRAEGLTFVAQRDASGDILKRNCTYVIEGSTPPARFWTLYVGDPSLVVLGLSGLRKPTTHSQEIIRLADNSFSITVASRASPGNWLAIAGAGPMTFVLTLYDTPIASSTGVADVTLPQVLRTGCNG